jgi:hypothetical protein
VPECSETEFLICKNNDLLVVSYKFIEANATVLLLQCCPVWSRQGYSVPTNIAVVTWYSVLQCIHTLSRRMTGSQHLQLLTYLFHKLRTSFGTRQEQTSYFQQLSVLSFGVWRFQRPESALVLRPPSCHPEDGGTDSSTPDYTS